MGFWASNKRWGSKYQVEVFDRLLLVIEINVVCVGFSRCCNLLKLLLQLVLIAFAVTCTGLPLELPHQRQDQVAGEVSRDSYIFSSVEYPRGLR